MPACCLSPQNYKPGPDPYKRPGWEKVTCEKCGKLLGYHPIEKNKSK